VVICAFQDLIGELDRHSLTFLRILLSYDTVFCLEEIYEPSFLFCHVLFCIIPAAFLLHEQKFKCMHDSFMAFIRKELPSLSNVKSPIPIVTDDERGICNAIDKHLTGVVCVSCWNHIINAAKLCLSGAKSAEIPFYVSNLLELFNHPTWNAFLEKYESLKKMEPSFFGIL